MCCPATLHWCARGVLHTKEGGGMSWYSLLAVPRLVRTSGIPPVLCKHSRPPQLDRPRHGRPPHWRADGRVQGGLRSLWQGRRRNHQHQGAGDRHELPGSETNTSGISSRSVLLSVRYFVFCSNEGDNLIISLFPSTRSLIQFPIRS